MGLFSRKRPAGNSDEAKTAAPPPPPPPVLGEPLPAENVAKADTVAAIPVDPLAQPAVAAAATALTGGSRGILSGKRNLLTENEQLREALEAIGLKERALLAEEIAGLRQEKNEVAAEIAAARAELVEVRDQAILQEVGIYEYQHRLADAVAYKDRLEALRGRIKAQAKSNTAVRASSEWTVNNSKREGQKMVREYTKLMLRAYNTEADDIARRMRPYALESAIARLDKARDVISKLGKTMSITIDPGYHALRIDELKLTADYLAKAAEEKEAEREERARIREEEQARREFEREKARLLKEAAHYEKLLVELRAQGDDAGAEEAEAHLGDVQGAIGGIEEREANIRAGYVYVISNVGSFGERMVKVGLTRRLDPMDRVRELGDASVPFGYDVHALIFSKDAVGLETRLHQELAAHRVNLVNLRREFFYTTPAEVLAILERLQGKEKVLSFIEEPEAAEWHQSENTRRQPVAAGARVR
ncbi:MAG: DUF4041 domain-containing protein [Thermoleophilia bacterium]